MKKGKAIFHATITVIIVLLMILAVIGIVVLICLIGKNHPLLASGLVLLIAGIAIWISAYRYFRKED